MYRWEEAHDTGVYAPTDVDLIGEWNRDVYVNADGASKGRITDFGLLENGEWHSDHFGFWIRYDGLLGDPDYFLVATFDGEHPFTTYTLCDFPPSFLEKTKNWQPMEDLIQEDVPKDLWVNASVQAELKYLLKMEVMSE
jgi:hypothetical protein